MSYYPGYPGFRFSTSFEQTCRCYPASFIASLQIECCMLFELYNPSENHKSYCGVLEFVAEEGMNYMPYWMMQNMLLQEGDTVRVKNATLKKGTYVKLQPHTKDFLDISNPKALLETTLRNYSCLTTRDSIMVPYNNKKYFIDIVEAKPEPAISIIETDCEVALAAPLDYKEPERAALATVPVPTKTVQDSDHSTDTVELPKFNPFTGVGRRLDGKPLKYSAAPITSARNNSQSASTNTSSRTQSGTLPTTQRRASGKLVFSANANAPSASSKRKKKTQRTSKFQAFSGKSYSLKP